MRLGVVRTGKVDKVPPGSPWRVMARTGRGGARFGKTRLPEVGLGQVRLGRLGLASLVRARYVEDWQAAQRRGQIRLVTTGHDEVRYGYELI